jgi:hypothetical protein
VLGMIEINTVIIPAHVYAYFTRYSAASGADWAFPVCA